MMDAKGCRNERLGLTFQVHCTMSDTPSSHDPSTQPGADSAAPVRQRLVDDGRKDRQAEMRRLDPTRYGDWEKNGRCIDF